MVGSSADTAALTALSLATLLPFVSFLVILIFTAEASGALRRYLNRGRCRLACMLSRAVRAESENDRTDSVLCEHAGLQRF